MSNPNGFYDRLKVRRRDHPELEACIREVVQKLCSEKTDLRKPGLLLGKIQSGKTRAFLGIIALAFDKGFDVAVVLTKGTKVLAGQTVNRASADFAEFCTEDRIAIFDILRVPKLTKWEIGRKKLIFVAKKEHNNLRRLLTLFCDTYPLLQKKRVLIVDDEADYASIRFAKDANSQMAQGPVADLIDDLRRHLPLAAFLQVTATPYSLYLQPEEYSGSLRTNFICEPKRPAFRVMLPNHAAYVGGDHYFGHHDPSQPEYYLFHPVAPKELAILRRPDRRRANIRDALTNPCISDLRHALVTFVTAASARRWHQETLGETTQNYAMVVHVETSRRAHTWQHAIVLEIVEAIKEAISARDEKVDTLIDDAIEDLARIMRDGEELGDDCGKKRAIHVANRCSIELQCASALRHSRHERRYAASV